MKIELFVERSMIKEVLYKYGEEHCQILGIGKDGLYPIIVEF